MVVGQGQAEFAVDLGFILGRGLTEDVQQPAERGHDVADLFPAHPSARRLLASDHGEVGLGDRSLGLDLSAPLRDQSRVGAGLQSGPVAAQLAVALLQRPTGRLDLKVVDGPGRVQLHQRLLDARRAQGLGQPGVERVEDGVFADVDGQGVVELVGDGVLVGEPAAVVRPAVVPVALHPASALGVQQSALEGVGVPGAQGPAGRCGAAGGQALLGAVEVVGADDGRVGGAVGEDPLVLGVPLQVGLVSEGDVLDVDQQLLLALLVPHLEAGVAGVHQDGADRALGPGDAGPVAVALRVVGGRAGDAVVGQALGNRVDADTGQVLGEDPLDHHGGDRVEFEAVQALAVCGLRRVRVRAGVDQHVAVRRSTAEEAPFDLRLCGHRGPHPDLDAVPLALADATEDRHDEVVRFGFRVDGTADLRHPERDTVVGEDGEREPELIAVEGALRFADDDSVEPAVRVLERFQ
ncbi:hypothetical protein POF50_010985 [Streptomyces sp. SL13]|uniref:Uncharacterized protein n=1 Tax=Streptantibioticus silvisoli TaxID=2705255 RepID=A0AA90K8B5_9ACTN|nr:hypothetical protein [Streptantibioticus silvisoli]